MTVLTPVVAVAAELDAVVMTYWGDWTVADGVDGIDRAKALGAHTVSILVMLCQDNQQASLITYCGEGNRAFRETKAFARLDALKSHLTARGMGFNMMPFILNADGSRRHTIWPRDRDAWFASYAQRAEELAEYAQTSGNRSFIVASELASMYVFDWKWREVFARVRRVYTGHITVATLVGTHEAVTFWDALDSIGVSAYFPLTVSKRVRSVWALRIGWEAHRLHLLVFAKIWGRPLHFVELGYPTTDVAAVKPWDFAFDQHAYDAELQSRCFEAFRQTWEGDETLVGVQYWGLSNPALDRDVPKNYTPYGKPAADRVRAIFADREGLP